jgi:hypothetical protein
MSIESLGIDWGKVAVTYLFGVVGFVAGIGIGSLITVPKGFRRKFTVLVFFLSVPLIVLAALLVYIPLLGSLCAAIHGAMLGFLGFCTETEKQ